ncbi:dipicolinate synthase subunit DpsA [Marinicrinis lubricantis]|uniref:Dipicolinate synthase subunit DpsA n=1 Tax=Marinicrinis lubricantis TaxID=2086470 RepID=A0ABW1IMA4_9BACL
MLTGIHAVFIGGDARQLEVIQKFAEKDATVTLIGFDNLQNQFSGVKKASLSEELLREADVILLPAVGTDDNGKIDSIFSSEELILTEELMRSMKKRCTIYTGMAKPYLKKMCHEHGVRLVELFDRDDVAIYNSVPTAEGALMLAIQNTDITIHGSECIVLGLGRTGITMARTLQGIGAKVKVGVRKKEHYARAEEMRFNPFYVQDLASEVSNVDLIFNTVPAMIVTAQVISHMPHRSVIIDLASRPGGTDFRFAEKRGIKAILAPGLPGIVAPKSAGKIIANCVIDLIMEDQEKWGNG